MLAQKSAATRCASRRNVACFNTRRDVLIATSMTVAAPLIMTKPANAEKGFLEVDNLSSFQKADQRTEFAARAQSALKEVLTASDAPACIRLAMHDAGTFDLATKSGGFDGSIILNDEELNRPENASLKDIVAKLREAKEKIDAGDNTGAGPISWADTIYLAGRVATEKAWYEIKVGSAETQSGGKVIATAFKNPWPLELGRIDSTEPGPNRVPAPDADVEEIRTFLLALGAKPGAGANPFTPKAPFWERPGYLIWTATADDPAAEEARFVQAQPENYAGVKKNYDVSKRTVTRTDYEVDFAVVYNKLCGMGAKFDQKKYLYRVPITKIV